MDLDRLNLRGKLLLGIEYGNRFGTYSANDDISFDSIY